MSSTWGNKIKVSIFGESHGPAVGCVIDGLPSGFEVNFEELEHQLLRRSSKNYQDLSTSRKEIDNYEIISGFKKNITTGTPVCVIFKNKDVKSEFYSENCEIPRPGSVDYTNFRKYGSYYDFRGSGHNSARLTLPLTFAGSISKQLLKRKYGIEISSHIYSLQNIKDTSFNELNLNNKLLEKLSEQAFPVINEDIKNDYLHLIHETKKSGDTLGGVIESAIIGIPAGIGDPIFDGIENKVASIIFGIPAVKGIEFGAGFEIANLKGSQANDEFYFDESAQVKTKTNNSGGILGGISNGMPIIFRVAFKPIPSIAIEQSTINLKTQQNVKIKTEGRHDCCTVLRAVPIIESATALAISDLII